MIKLKHSLEIDHYHKTTIPSHCPSSTSQGPTHFKRLTSIFIIWLSYVFKFCIDAQQNNDKCFFQSLISCNKVANLPHVLYVVNVKVMKVNNAWHLWFLFLQSWPQRLMLYVKTSSMKEYWNLF
jgi:hypothetical protein